MKELMIEIRKYKVKNIISYILAYNAVLLVFLFVVGNTTGQLYMFEDIKGALIETNNALIWPSSVIFMGLCNNLFFVQEFREKTINNLFVTGTKRLDIIRGKLVLLFLVGIITGIFTTVVMDSFLYLTTDYTYYAEHSLSISELLNQYFLRDVFLNIVMVSLVPFLSLAIGMARYSFSLTFTSGLLIAAVWACQISGFNLSVQSIRLVIMTIGVSAMGYILLRVKRVTL